MGRGKSLLNTPRTFAGRMQWTPGSGHLCCVSGNVPVWLPDHKPQCSCWGKYSSFPSPPPPPYHACFLLLDGSDPWYFESLCNIDSIIILNSCNNKFFKNLCFRYYRASTMSPISIAMGPPWLRTPWLCYGRSPWPSCLLEAVLGVCWVGPGQKGWDGRPLHSLTSTWNKIKYRLDCEMYISVIYRFCF